MHIKKPAFPAINFKITDIKVVDVQREKIDITALAKAIFRKTGNGASLPPDERELVGPFLDPKYVTDDVPLLERFLVIYEKTMTGAYSKPVPAPDAAPSPPAGAVPVPDIADIAETDENISNVLPGTGFSL